MTKKILSSDSLVSDTLGDNFIVDNEISEDKLLQLVSTDYSEAYERAKKGYFIFRGDKVSFDMAIRTPGIRVSVGNGLNYYNRLFSNVLDSWSNYPKRNRAFICTTTYEYAKQYNDNVNIVLPKNGTLLGICPDYNMWASFSLHTNIERMLYFNTDLGLMFRFLTGDALQETNNFFKIATDEEVINYMDEISEQIRNTDIDELMNYIDEDITNKKVFEFIVNRIHNNDNDLITLLSRIFNPKRNDFELTLIEDYHYKLGDWRELWFSSKAIFVNVKYIWQNRNKDFYNEIFNDSNSQFKQIDTEELELEKDLGLTNLDNVL